jgi:diguanylate cyclase (GGDEF)-like protein/PAS domain S-box-containing protein
MTSAIATNHPNEAATYTAMTRKASLGFIYVVASLFIAAGLALVSLCFSLDDRQMRHSETIAAKVFESRQDKIVTALADYAFWIDAYKHLGDEINMGWAYEGDNIGPSLFPSYGLEGVFVLGPDASTRYGLVEGTLSDVPAGNWIDGELPVLLADARRKSADNGVAHAFFSVDGMPAAVYVAVIRPDSSYDVERLSFLVFVDVLTGADLLELGQVLELRGLSATLGTLPHAPGPKLTLQSDIGSAVTLLWQSENQGTSLLKMFLPLLILLGLLVSVLVCWLRKRVLHATRMIDVAQRALKVSEQRFKNISEASSDWIWEADSQQRLTYLSDRFTQMTGYSRDAWLGRPLTELLAYESQLLVDIAGPGAVGRKPIPCELRDSAQCIRYCQLSARAVRMGAELTGYQGTVCDITEEIEAKAHIEHISQHDALTGLANRHRLNDFLASHLAAGLSHDQPVYLLALDLDRFKPINDTFGHAAGDRVLREVASALTGCTRDTDLVARLGGDEFIVVTTDCRTRDQVERLCQRLIDQINQPSRIAGNEVSVGVSIGIACAPVDGLTGDDLLRFADLALYEAKSSGRNHFEFYERAMSERITQRRQLEMDMRQALRTREFYLEFQPRYEAAARHIVGAEALVRWLHPNRGLLSPGCFIPLAEETGLIVELSDWVLEEACMTALSWPDELMISVNLSPVEFQRNDLVDRVASVLKRTGIDPQRLELEITESVMLEDAAAALITMNELKALGIRLSMDDFGTGYSSLSYLRNYPFDGIKIDRSFISGLDQSQSSEAIVSAIIKMGHALSLTVTAEGIETIEQLGKLKELACDQAQGYYLGHPMSPIQFRQITARNVQATKTSATTS